MRVALDIDGVLADFGSHFLNHLDIPDKTPARGWNDPRFTENFTKVHKDENFWLTIPRLIDPEELDFIPVAYITARPIRTHITKQWLKKNGFPEAPVFTVGVNGSKINAFKDSNAEIIIDDAVHNYVELNKAGCPCLLLTRSHNEKFDAEYRIKSVNEVLNFEEIIK